MTRRFHDYDAAFAEAESEPIEVVLFGETWELPATMPAAFPLAITALVAEGIDPNKDLTFGQMIELTRKLVPVEILNAWLAKGLSIERLPQILTDLLEDYGWNARSAEGETNAPPGAIPTSSPLSSNAGPSSKPTSGGNTGSTSRPTSAESAGADS